MSNTRKPRKPRTATVDNSVILTEENKFLVSKMLHYSLEACEDILAKAKSEGYDKVRLHVQRG